MEKYSEMYSDLKDTCKDTLTVIGGKISDLIGKLLELGNAYAKESDWKDFALVKFCLCAIGILIGLSLPKKCRKVATVIAAIVFIAAYIQLMIKVVKIGIALFQEDHIFVEE